MIAAEAPERIVVGEPRTLAGERGAQARSAAGFAARLRGRVDVPVELWDERLTTVEARRRAREGGSQADLDSLAACVLLEAYLATRVVSTRSRRPRDAARPDRRRRRARGGGGRTLLWLGLIVLLVVAVGWALARGSFGDDPAPGAGRPGRRRLDTC